MNEHNYTYDEVYKASLEYFNGDELAAKVFIDKYALQDNNTYYELTPTDMHRRLAKEFYRIEQNYPNSLSYQEILNYFLGFKYIVPQGSVMAGVGNKYQKSSLSNCIILSPVQDSYAGITYTDAQLALLCKRRCGVGFDLSLLRPEGFKVDNPAKKSTGPVSFMERFSHTIREAAQCIAEGQRVLTNHGLKKIENVKPFYDKVWTKLGWIDVVETMCNGSKLVYRITTQKGFSIETTEDHLFCIEFNNKLCEKQLKDLSENDILVLLPGANEITHILYQPLYKPVYFKYRGSTYRKGIKFPNHLSEKLAYILGYSYGDGNVTWDRYNEPTYLSLSCATSWCAILNKLLHYIYDEFNILGSINQGDGKVYKLRICSKEICAFLQYNGLLKNNHAHLYMPEIIYKSPNSVQMAFIAGYFDADGGAHKKSGYRIRSIQEEFLKECQNILMANGIVSKVMLERPKINNWKNLYSLTIVGKYACCFATKKLHESCKIKNSPINPSKDSIRTPYTAKLLSIPSHVYNYIGSTNYLSCSVFERYKDESKRDDLPGVQIQDHIKTIELVGAKNTYDLNLSSEHLFYCEGFSVHNSGRRGAGLLSMHINHPDIDKFIKAKKDLTKITGANISVLITDEFMNAVKQNKKFIQKWPVDAKNPLVVKEINAKELWDELIKQAHKTAEPGLVFWDRHHLYSTSSIYPEYKNVGLNPCCFASKSDVYVVTDSGIKEIKNITSKDKIWVDEVKGWAHTSGYFTVGEDEIYKVTLSSGNLLYITNNHKLQKVKVTENKIIKSLIPLSQLKIGDKIGVSKHTPASITDALEIVDIECYGRDVVGCIEVYKYHTFVANGIISGNSEICTGETDSCRLMAINLFSFVDNPFTEDAHFNYKLFNRCVYDAERLMDDLVDLELEHIQDILNKIDNDPEPTYIKAIEKKTWEDLYKTGKNGRRTGLGFTALADTLAALGLKYDSEEALVEVEKIMSEKCKAEFSSSIDMAIERGSFIGYDKDIEHKSLFISMLKREFPDLYAKMKVHGRRNISLSTCAPTGSVSILTQTSSGLEPVYQLEYKRRKKINPTDKNIKIDYIDNVGDKWQEFQVTHPKLQMWKDITNNDNIDDSPYYQQTAYNINWKNRIKLQSIIQKYTTHSLSSTINLPQNTSLETINDIYVAAWEKGLKGVTVYVDKSRAGVLVGNTPSNIPKNNAPKRPKELDCNIHLLTVRGEKWVVLIGLLADTPFECFAFKHKPLLDSEQIKKLLDNESSHKFVDGTGGLVPPKLSNAKLIRVKRGVYNLCADNFILENIRQYFDVDEQESITRLVSLSLRHGADIEFICSQLQKSYGDVTSFNKAIARVLRKYINGKTKSFVCVECGSKEMEIQEGCSVCKNCGNSSCG